MAVRARQSSRENRLVHAGRVVNLTAVDGITSLPALVVRHRDLHAARHGFRTVGSVKGDLVDPAIFETGSFDPDLDPLLDAALLTADYDEGVDLTRQAQRILLDNGQYGNVVLYNYISRSARWNYFQGSAKVEPMDGTPGEGYNIFAGHLAPGRWWLNQDDPSFADRPDVSL